MIGCGLVVAAYAAFLALVLWAGYRLRQYRDRLPRPGESGTRRASH